MSDQNAKTQYVQTPLDDASLILFTPCPSAAEVGGKKPWSRFIWGFRKNMLVVSVATADPNDKTRENDNGWIRHEFNRVQYENLFRAWDQLLASSKEDDKREVRVDKPTWSQQDNRKVPKYAGSVIFIKKSGIYSIAATSWNTSRPRIQFIFGEDRFHHYVNANGEPITDADMSRMTALAHRDAVKDIVDHLYRTTWVPEERKERGGQNTGSSGNNHQPRQNAGNNYGGGQSTDSSSFDEMDNDIPF